MTKKELTWLAGFFDGEGHCGFVKKRIKSPSGKTYTKRHLYLGITQKERAVLDWIKARLGYGTVIRNKQQSPFSSGYIHYWRTSHGKARKLLLLLLPLLKTTHKTKQVLKALRKDAAFVSKSHNPAHTPIWSKTDLLILRKAI